MKSKSITLEELSGIMAKICDREINNQGINFRDDVNFEFEKFLKKKFPSFSVSKFDTLIYKKMENK
jgi:hypothetical protein